MRAPVRLRFEPLQPDESSLLVAFFSGSDWPFHFERCVDASWVQARLGSGYFFGADTRSFWIHDDHSELPLGLARVFELSDTTPLFDLRIRGGARGRGVGTLGLGGLTTWLFSEYPETERLGGYTRYDNLSMRRVFEKCGFQQEAHHRRGWRVAGGAPVDAVGYAILREEAGAL